MEKTIPYWRRRLRWANSSTLTLPRKWSWMRWVIDLAALPIIFFVLTQMHAYIMRGSAGLFSDWPVQFQELGAWNIFYTIISGLIVFAGQWMFNWIRIPGKLDQHLRDEIERFRGRLRPNIWITGIARENRRDIDFLGQDGMSVGFVIANKSDSDMYDVMVELVKLETASFVSHTEHGVAISNFGEEGDCEWDSFQYVDLPILLEWRPQSQVSEGVSVTDIPAGSSREIGLFYGDQILAANHGIWDSCRIASHSFIHRVAFRGSARMIRTITSQDYAVSREGSGEINSIPFVIEPNRPFELLANTED